MDGFSLEALFITVFIIQDFMYSGLFTITTFRCRVNNFTYQGFFSTLDAMILEEIAHDYDIKQLKGLIKSVTLRICDQFKRKLIS